MRTVALTLLIALCVPAGARAQAQTAQPAQTPGTTPPTGQGTTLTPPLSGTLPSPPPEAPQNVAEPPPAPLPPRPAAKPRKRPWIGPTVIALEAAAVGFAIASVTVLSVGGKDDTWRYPTAAGLGGGVIACAGVGIIIELVAR